MIDIALAKIGTKPQIDQLYLFTSSSTIFHVLQL